jgi:two-component system, sensor histidine kinase
MNQDGHDAVAARRVVMHVEDDAEVRAAVRLLLVGEGYEVLSFADGASAVTAIESRGATPDLLISDYHLGSGMNGTDVAERVARLLRYPLPVILLTADPANAEVPWLTRAPVWLLPKPPDAGLLLAGIGPLTDLSRRARNMTSPVRGER